MLLDAFSNGPSVRNPWDRLVSCWFNEIVDRDVPTESGVVRWNQIGTDALERLGPLVVLPAAFVGSTVVAVVIWFRFGRVGGNASRG